MSLMTGSQRVRLATSVLLLTLIGTPLCAQETARKVKTRVSPAYPELAKKMNIRGVVRLEVTINPSGSVQTIKPLGGHPVLLDAATTAMKRWKFEPGGETSEVIEFKFNVQ